jgi:D-alanyl-D-alanine carboxypeptidase/D-alanyl-D-alanine-endopeptidase (penicillin-binding protein 4)
VDLMRQPWTRAGLGVAAVAVFGSLGLSPSGTALPQPELSLPRWDVPPRPALIYTVAPDVRPDSAQAVLERRLAALAAAVEGRMAHGVPTGVLPEFDVEGLAAAIEAELALHSAEAQLSVHVRDLGTQQVLFDWFGDTPLNPASNQKLVTSSAALDLLGADYTFTTGVWQAGNDLYLRGTGDPMLTLDDLNAIATLVTEKVDMAALRRLVIDDSAFSAQRFGPGYSADGVGLAYEAPSGALSLNFNTVEVTVYPVKGEPRPAVVVDAPGAHIEIVNKAVTGRRGFIGVRTYEDDGKTIVEVTGRVSKRARPQRVRRRIFDPGMYTGTAFATVLAQHTASEPLPVVRGIVPTDAESILVNDSAPLVEVLDAGLAYSNNFVAEQVLRTLAWRMTGDPGDWRAGQEILQGYWSALGNDPHALVVENAAGLSRTGRVTTAGLVDLISVAYRTHEGGHSLIDALPVAGEPGTMQYRLRMSGKRVRAKTGTLRGVSGLTGVITSESGTPQVAFSIIINADEPQLLEAKSRRDIEDRIVTSVLQALDDFEARRSGIAD